MRGLLILIFLLSLALPAAAQPAPAPDRAARASGQLILPTIDGDTVTCHDFSNRLVNYIDVDQLGDAGRAEFLWGTGPVVMTDPELMRTLPVSLRVFFKLHECGHHALGHLLAPNALSEREADCWAIAQGHMLEAFNRATIESWRPYFSDSHGDRDGHLPGPQRVEFLLSCYTDAPGIMASLR